MVDYKYEWIEDLIHYCSDPFNRFPRDEDRADRAFTVLFGILKYSVDGKLKRQDYVDFLLNEIKTDNKGRGEREFSRIKSDIEDIIDD